MILLCEGVPGAGKTFWAVGERLIQWIKRGRRLYVYLDGADLKKWALFVMRSEEGMVKLGTIWKTRQEVLDGLLTVKPNSVVFIDEWQTLFRSKSNLNPDVLRWLETHRHH